MPIFSYFLNQSKITFVVIILIVVDFNYLVFLDYVIAVVVAIILY